MALLASDVKINPNLAASLGGIGTQGNNAIAGAFGSARSRLMADAKARGMNGTKSVSPNSYAGQQIGTNQGLATGNLEAVLGSGLGNTSYNDALQQRDFGQQEDLARETAALNKPNLLDQIFQGIGAVGGTGAKIYGALGGRRSPSSTLNSGGATLPASSMISLIPGGSPSGYYSNPYGGGY